MTTQRAILEALKMTEGYPLPRKALLADVCGLTGREISLTELKEEMGKLEARRCVTVIVGEDDGGDIEVRTHCWITNNGKARLRE
jgi:hypothetical protein